MSRVPIHRMQQQCSQSDEHESQRQVVGKARLLESAVNAASAVNKVLMENCGLCTVYCDEQLKYEDWVHYQYHVTALSMNHLLQKINPNAQFENENIKHYQEFLFDEESVLENVASRDRDE
jgi:hypothetical protein